MMYMLVKFIRSARIISELSILTINDWANGIICESGYYMNDILYYKPIMDRPPKYLIYKYRRNTMSIIHATYTGFLSFLIKHNWKNITYRFGGARPIKCQTLRIALCCICAFDQKIIHDMIVETSNWSRGKPQINYDDKEFIFD